MDSCFAGVIYPNICLCVFTCLYMIIYVQYMYIGYIMTSHRDVPGMMGI